MCSERKRAKNNYHCLIKCLQVMPGVMSRDGIINNILTASIYINNNSFSHNNNIFSDSKVNNSDMYNDPSNNIFIDNSSFIVSNVSSSSSVNISDIFMDGDDMSSDSVSDSGNAFINGTFNNQTDTYQVDYLNDLTCTMVIPETTSFQ